MSRPDPSHRVEPSTASSGRRDPMERFVGVAQMAVSRDPAEVLVTHSLGSCVGLSVWDPVARVGGLAHFMMPASRGRDSASPQRPCRYVDVGAVIFLRAVLSRGASRRALVVKVAGGASVSPHVEPFDIGRHNYTVLRKLLWKNDVLIAGEDVGGTVARAMSIEIGTGTTRVGHDGAWTEI